MRKTRPMDETAVKVYGWWGCADWGVGSNVNEKLMVWSLDKECGNTRKAWEVFNDPAKHGCCETDGSFGSKDRAGPLGFGVRACPIVRQQQ